ncbi:hypothetical protein EC988_000717 [Linderina pennispora]|nr:hypothetical protein EC988_000717 [Linderina pennispora]
MEAEMDLIRQRSSHDSGHGSATGIVSAASLIHQQHQISSYQPGYDFHQPEIIDGPITNDMSPHSMSTNISAEPSVYHYSLSHPHTTSSPSTVMGSTSMAFPSSTTPSAADTVRNLIGSSIATGAKLQNTDGSLGIFFVFPDLSIRKDGEYRLRFSFFDLKSIEDDVDRSD